MIKLSYSNSQEAYDEINKFFFNQKDKIECRGGGRYGGQMVAYNVHIKIDDPWVDPEFDFGNMFGYRAQKWSGLKKNYIDNDDLDNLIVRIATRTNKKTKNYTESMVFHNKHGHGKGCLLSMTCIVRNGNKPIIHFHIRSSEVTKRLLMDLLLIKRIGDMLYEDYSLELSVLNMYQNAEAFTMLDNHIPLWEMIKPDKATGLPNSWQQKVIDTLNHFKECNIDDVKMKVHKRCVRQLQRPNGIPLSGDRPMLAKDLKL